jgi:DUF4097 and DUF4098 domain-containing protein YvlB
MPAAEGALPMKPLRLTRIAALLVFLIPAFATAQETERVHKVVPLGPGGTLSLHNFSGAVRIVGADVNEVTIDAVRTATRDRLDHIKLDIQSSGSTVTIDANKKDADWTEKNNNVVKTEFDIQVPRGATLEVDVFSSDVHVRGVSGKQSVKTFSGIADLQDAAARVTCKTFSGAITVQTAGAAPDLDLETFSGDIALRLPDGAKASLSFDSFSGQLTADMPLTLQEQRKGHLRADLNGGDPQRPVRLKTFSGDVKVGK